ncbi:hypothetical protein EIP86_010085 [Pleurotus ostreatoroseus]|nr:hypothetical protein EIP86_010085 [Pleurotus ostreatoroseus]
MASVVLVSANLTNLVLAGAYSLSFIKYTVHVILPFLAGAVSVYPVFMLLFRSSTLIPPSLELDLDEQQNESQALTDKKGAIFGSILLLITLAVLVGTSTIGVAVWQVTVPPAVIMLMRDTYYDWSHTRKRRPADAMDDIPREMPLKHFVSPEAATIEMDAVASEPKSEKELKEGFATEITGTPYDTASIDIVL